MEIPCSFERAIKLVNTAAEGDDGESGLFDLLAAVASILSFFPPEKRDFYIDSYMVKILKAFPFDDFQNFIHAVGGEGDEKNEDSSSV